MVAEVKRILFMNPVVFIAATRIEADVEKVFAFHENPENLRKIAPDSLRIRSISCSPHAVVGECFELVATQFGLPIRWRGVWEVVEHPGQLTDGAEVSPFAHWRHSHIFERDGDGCRMTDRVECALPGGWVGGLVGAIVLPVIFGVMFRARHAATREWFRREATTGGRSSPA
jgi:hypothetical protein